jgi:hypothetical protein
MRQRGALVVGASGWAALVVALVFGGPPGAAAPPAVREGASPRPRLSGRDTVQSVLVANTTAEAVQVRSVDQGVLQPVQHQENIEIGPGFQSGCTEFPVPAGKRLVIEYVSGHSAISAPYVLAQVAVSTVVGGTQVAHLLPTFRTGVDGNGRDVFVAGQSTRLYADPDSSVLVCGSREGASPEPTVFVFLGFSGHLTDVNP